MDLQVITEDGEPGTLQPADVLTTTFWDIKVTNGTSPLLGAIFSTLGALHSKATSMVLIKQEVSDDMFEW